MSDEPSGHEQSPGGRSMWVIGGAAVLAVVVFGAGWLSYARRNHHRMLKECDELFAPLVAGGAGPDSVQQRTGVSGETYAREKRDLLIARVADLGGPSARIGEAADQLASTRVYLADYPIVYVAFFDASDRVKSYACFSRVPD